MRKSAFLWSVVWRLTLGSTAAMAGDWDIDLSKTTYTCRNSSLSLGGTSTMKMVDSTVTISISDGDMPKFSDEGSVSRALSKIQAAVSVECLKGAGLSLSSPTLNIVVSGPAFRASGTGSPPGLFKWTIVENHVADNASRSSKEQWSNQQSEERRRKADQARADEANELRAQFGEHYRPAPSDEVDRMLKDGAYKKIKNISNFSLNPFQFDRLAAYARFSAMVTADSAIFEIYGFNGDAVSHDNIESMVSFADSVNVLVTNVSPTAFSGNKEYGLLTLKEIGRSGNLYPLYKATLIDVYKCSDKHCGRLAKFVK